MLTPVQYKYYWNEAKDTEGRSMGFFGFEEGQALSLAYEGTINSLPDEDEKSICERLFHIFNADYPVDYRGPSMSVGSVVQVGEISMACSSIGFINVDITKSPIVKAWWKK